MRGFYAVLVVAGVTVAACGANAGENGDAVRGAKLFRACQACHTIDKDGGNIVGPRLYGLFGRRAGAVADYKYSDALKKSGIVWTAETVDKLFALGPAVFTPGSKMPLQAMGNAKRRADLIAYLKIATAPRD